MRIAVVGIGYVGCSLAVLLAGRHHVTALDIDAARVEMLNRGKSPIKDRELESVLASGKPDLTATQDEKEAYRDADYVIIATPTDFNSEKNRFDTSSVEKTLQCVFSENPNAKVVIKSTIPIGFTREVYKKYSGKTVLFSPEFLREGRALADNLFPERIIVGIPTHTEKMKKDATAFAHILSEVSENKCENILVMDSSEAEAVKLFSNTYLAMRVSFFNELDSFAVKKDLNAANIIAGVCADGRIGNFYNNPSFGYGGYCLPKDSRQLLSSFGEIPEEMIQAIVRSNETRKKLIAEDVLARHPKCVGIYRLAMKSGSDNSRASAVLDVMKFLYEAGVSLIVYEPGLKSEFCIFGKVIRDFSDFCEQSDLILANRFDDNLIIVKEKVYTRDLYLRD